MYYILIGWNRCISRYDESEINKEQIFNSAVINSFDHRFWSRGSLLNLFYIGVLLYLFQCPSPFFHFNECAINIPN